MAGARVPTVLGHDGGRMLLAEIAGEDLYAAGPPLLNEMVSLLVELQRSWEGRVEERTARFGPARLARTGAWRCDR